MSLKPLDSQLSIVEIVSDLNEFSSAIDEYDGQEGELVKAANKLLVNLKQIPNESYSVFKIEVKIKIIRSITSFKVIMTPKTGLMFRCGSCCLKKKRKRKHEQQCMIILLQLVEAIFLAQTFSVISKCESSIKEYNKLKSFADTIREISHTTSIFEIKNTLESKTSAREKLNSMLSKLDTYKDEYLTDKGGEQRSSGTPTRFRNIQVALASTPSTAASYGSYKKANKMLYDVATFGASLLLFKADEHLKRLNNEFIPIIKKSHRDAFSELDSIEVQSFTSNLIDEDLQLQLREYLDEVYRDANLKVVEASSRWSDLKSEVSASSFLSSFFGSADDDLENLFSSSSFMSLTQSVVFGSGSGNNNNNSGSVPKTKMIKKEVTESDSRNVTDFFNNIKLPNKDVAKETATDVTDFFNNIKLPISSSSQNNKSSNNSHEPPIYNLHTKQPVNRNNNESKRVSAPKKSSSSSSDSSDSDSSRSAALRSSKKTPQVTATSYVVSSVSEPPPPPSRQEAPPSYSLDVIDFEEDNPPPSSSSSSLHSSAPLLSSSERHHQQRRRPSSSSSTASHETMSNDGKVGFIFSSKLNTSKISQAVSGSISRTAMKASAIASETKEKVATSTTHRIFKNSYTSLKNKSEDIYT